MATAETTQISRCNLLILLTYNSLEQRKILQSQHGVHQISKSEKLPLNVGLNSSQDYCDCQQDDSNNVDIHKEITEVGFRSQPMDIRIITNMQLCMEIEPELLH